MDLVLCGKLKQKGENIDQDAVTIAFQHIISEAPVPDDKRQTDTDTMARIRENYEDTKKTEMGSYFVIGIICTVLQASYNLVDETGHSILFDVLGPLYGPVTWLATLVNMASIASVAYRLRKGMFILALRFITSIIWPIAIARYLFDKLVTFKKEGSRNN